jgi:undecaprenyl-diphosphatase
VFSGTEGIPTDAEVTFLGEPPTLNVSDQLAGRFFNAYGSPIDGGPEIEGEVREIGGPSVNPYKRRQPSELIPTGIAGILLDDVIDNALSSSWVISFMLITVGVLLIWMEFQDRDVKVTSIGRIAPIHALLVGFWQILALIPGTSRSGATIFGETMMGFNRVTAVEFSFFLAIPVMFGASLLKIVKYMIGGAAMSMTAVCILLAGMAAAFFVSMVFIRFMMNYIRQHDFTLFGFYRIILGVLMLIFTLFGVLA